MTTTSKPMPLTEVDSFVSRHIGPSAEYLLNTVARCEELGVHDPYLWRMQALVAERMIAEEQL